MAKKYSYISPKSPPSSYAIAGALEGEKGAWFKVIGGTLQRSLFLAPGLALSGIKGKELLKGSIFGSASITGFVFILYILRKKGIIKTWS